MNWKQFGTEQSRFNPAFILVSTWQTDPAIAVSTWLPTSAAQVRVQVKSYGISFGQSCTGAGSPVLGFPKPKTLPPIAPHSSVIRGWYNMVKSGQRAGSHPNPRNGLPGWTEDSHRNHAGKTRFLPRVETRHISITVIDFYLHATYICMRRVFNTLHLMTSDVGRGLVLVPVREPGYLSGYSDGMEGRDSIPDRARIFLYSSVFWQALGPNWSLIYLVRVIFPRGKVARTCLHIMAPSGIRGYNSTTRHVFMA